LSPSHEFPPEENTAPDIYRKQALRIEELEKENKRLAKEASEGERRWKKAEEELEELREAEGDSSPKAKDASSTAGMSAQADKLVCFDRSL
jgi:predicted RNase H-like nuclease (RuvC/YqgF family)